MSSHTITPTVPDHLVAENGAEVYEEEKELSLSGRLVRHKPRMQNIPWPQVPPVKRGMWAKSGRKRLSKVAGGGKHGWLQNYWR